MGTHTRARGEGKIGCILSLLVLIAGVGAGYKIIPVYYANNNLQDFAGDLAGQAGFKGLPQIRAELRSKADALGILEATREGAIAADMVGDANFGTCNINLNYTQAVDLYGIYTLQLRTHKRISRTYRDVRQ